MADISTLTVFHYLQLTANLYHRDYIYSQYVSLAVFKTSRAIPRGPNISSPHQRLLLDWIDPSTIAAVERSPRLSLLFIFRHPPPRPSSPTPLANSPYPAWASQKSCTVNMYKMSLHFQVTLLNYPQFASRRARSDVPSARKRPAKESGECRPSGP